jgi:hypothetical protein
MTPPRKVCPIPDHLKMTGRVPAPAFPIPPTRPVPRKPLPQVAVPVPSAAPSSEPDAIEAVMPRPVGFGGWLSWLYLAGGLAALTVVALLSWFQNCGTPGVTP